MTALALSGGLLVLSVVTGLAWWGVWVLTHAAPALPSHLFPGGAAGRLGLAVVALAGIGAALAWAFKNAGWLENEESVVLEKKDALLLGGGVAAVVVFWWNIFARSSMPINMVFLDYFLPHFSLANELVHRGLLPLWNPWGNCGMPLLADPQVGVFYPLNLPLFIFGFYNGFRLWLLIHGALLYVFTYLWLREDLDPLPSAASAAVMAFNAYIASHALYLSNVSGFLWIPLLGHLLRRRSWVLFSLAAACQVLSGHPQFHYMTLVVLLLYMLAMKSDRRDWFRFAGSLAAAYGLALVQIAPTAELLRNSVRGGALAFHAAVNFSHTVKDLLMMVFVPQWWLCGRPVAGDPYMAHFYVGPAALLLAAAGAFQRKSAALRKMAAGLLVLGIIWSLGGNTPLYAWFHRLLPGFDNFRFPVQWMGLAVVGFSVLSGLGLSLLRVRFQWIPLAVILADLFVFNVMSPFFMVDPSFLAHRGPVIETLMRTEGRVIYSPELERWKFYDLVQGDVSYPFENFLALKEFGVNQGALFHVREAKTSTNHTLTGIAALQERGGEALRRMGVQFVVDTEDASDPAPRLVLREGGRTLPRFRLPAGEPLPMSGIQSLPHAVRISFPRPLDQNIDWVWGDAAYPGWAAFSGGVRRETFLAEDVFVGVKSRAGDRDVLLRYDAPSFFAGLAASAVFALLLAAWAVKRGNFARPEAGFFPAACFGVALLFLLKGACDAVGAPDINRFSLRPWEFVTLEDWKRFIRCEFLTGALLSAIGALAFRHGRRRPASE